MRGKEGNFTNPTKFLPLHFVKLAALASLVKDKMIITMSDELELKILSEFSP